MFPYRDDNPTLRPPVVTLLLVAANLAVWLVVQGMGVDQRLAASVCELGLVPGDLLGRLPPNTSFPVGHGMFCVVEPGTPWRTLVTSMFLHGGWLHLLGNCWFLWLFGNNVEDAMGHLRFAAFYLLCGLIAAGSQVWADPGSTIPMVGASGAISGVMGAYVILYPMVRVHILVIVFRFTIPAWLMLGWWFGMQVVNAQTDAVGGVAVWAHIGGFVGGALLTGVFRNPILVTRRARWLAHRRR